MPSALCAARVRYGRVPGPPTDPIVDHSFPDVGLRLRADRRRALLEVAEVGSFLVADGDRITVQVAQGVGPDAVSVVLHGPVVGLVLAQRGEFALHATTVAVGGAGIALTGASRAGKSTTALALQQRGHRLRADDVSPVQVRSVQDGSRTVSVTPFGRPVHVCPQTAAALGLDLAASRPVSPGRPKLLLPAPRSVAAIPLRAVVVLRPEAAATAVRVRALPAAAAITALGANAYLAPVAYRLRAAELLTWAVALSRCLPVWAITRPSTGWSVDEVARQVEAIAASPGGLAEHISVGSR